jgi:DNA-binding transcriptional MerR regulator/uncharacterized protein (DUF433 family)
MTDGYSELGRGVYDARRAAALSGIPWRTLHYWAQTGFYLPSVSPEPNVRLWSWLDLLALRTIDWLRKEKDSLPRTSIRKIRDALEQLNYHGISREYLHQFVVVSRGGDIFFDLPAMLVRADSGGQTGLTDVLQPIKPYRTGPDLIKPRPLLRIIPGKLVGEPHVVDTRISSTAIYALYRDGYELEHIQQMYAIRLRSALTEAIDLEQSLENKAA